MIDGKPHIVIIDDEDDILVILEDILDNHGYKVSTFYSAQESIDYILESKTVDLVITDVNMPDINGLELFQQVKSKLKTISFIFISGYDESTNASLGPLLVKPFSDHELIDLVKEKISKIK